MSLKKPSRSRLLGWRRKNRAPLLFARRSLAPWLREQLGYISQKTKLADAIRYAVSRLDGLTRFIDDGRIEINSNTVERSIRPIALNRRIALFAGSDVGAEYWATIASLIETALCRARHKAVYADRRTMPINQLFANVSGTTAAA